MCRIILTFTWYKNNNIRKNNLYNYIHATNTRRMTLLNQVIDYHNSCLNTTHTNGEAVTTIDNEYEDIFKSQNTYYS